jgi:hypothetical protein
MVGVQHHDLWGTADPPLSLVSPRVHFTAANVTALIHQAANDTNLIGQGYTLQCIGTHHGSQVQWYRRRLLDNENWAMDGTHLSDLDPLPPDWCPTHWSGTSCTSDVYSYPLHECCRITPCFFPAPQLALARIHLLLPRLASPSCVSPGLPLLHHGADK